MRIEMVGKNGFAPSLANKEYAEKKLSKLDSFLDNPEELTARIVAKVYKDMHKVEVTIPAKNLIMRAEVYEADVYAAIDKVVDKLMSQVKKYKEKTKVKIGKDTIRTQEILPEEKEPSLVRNKEIELEALSVEEAIDQMELLGHDFFIFLDKSTRKTNVVYIRDDGNYAVIETKNK